jgi:hypothetical protein
MRRVLYRLGRCKIVKRQPKKEKTFVFKEQTIIGYVATLTAWSSGETDPLQNASTRRPPRAIAFHFIGYLAGYASIGAHRKNDHLTFLAHKKPKTRKRARRQTRKIAAKT